MWNPEDYAKNSDAQLKWAQELRQNIDLPKYQSILDVGCGDGKITADFAATLPSSNVMGIDSSAAMVAYAAHQGREGMASWIRTNIEQDMDLGLLLYRDDYYNQDAEEAGVMEIIVGKNRNGSTGIYKVIFNPISGQFKALK